MKEVYAVIGAGYGDEGKGLLTDYLSSLGKKSLVIRFNGGAQAGHTVVSPDGHRHVFGHFGANSFLPLSKSVLSRFFVVNPLLFKKEYAALHSMGIVPQISCHSKAYVSTPYDMILNQLIEKKRGSARHGSCGVGFGQTIERHEVSNIKLYFEDLFLKTELIIGKIKEVQKDFLKEITKLDLRDLLNDDDLIHFLSQDFIQRFLNDCKDMTNVMSLVQDELSSEDLKDSDLQIVFEGAQGLMLDQHYGVFPHVTRSNTGLKNIVQIIENKDINLHVYYVSRSYVTRHGAGPLKNELSSKPYEGVVDKTNIDNMYQGSLRFAYLDVDVLKSAIEHDVKHIDGMNQSHFDINMAFSCMDQSDEMKFYKNDSLLNLPSKDFAKMLVKEFDFAKNILFSYSESRLLFKNKEDLN